MSSALSSLDVPGFLGTPRPAADHTPRSTHGSALQRFLAKSEQMGVTYVVCAPADVAAFARGIRSFPERIVSQDEHAFWLSLYREFRADDYRRRNVRQESLRQPGCDRGSWIVLAVKDNVVIGANTARIFCGEILPEYLCDLDLIEPASFEVRTDYRIAIAQAATRCRAEELCFCELSHWAVAPQWRRTPVGPSLVLMLGALTTFFVPHLGIAVANCDSGAFDMLVRMGARPMRRGGQPLPPFFHPAYGARLGLLECVTAEFIPPYRIGLDDRDAARAAMLIYSAG